MYNQWKIVDQRGDDVMTAAAVDAAAKRERKTPRQVAEREARLLVNVEAGDAPVFAVRAAPSLKVPPATLRTLQALDAADEKRLPYNEFRRATGVKTRAYYLFVNRLRDQNLIVEYGDLSRDHGYTLTFAGMQVLKNA